MLESGKWQGLMGEKHTAGHKERRAEGYRRTSGWLLGRNGKRWVSKAQLECVAVSDAAKRLLKGYSM